MGLLKRKPCERVEITLYMSTALRKHTVVGTLSKAQLATILLEVFCLNVLWWISWNDILDKVEMLLEEKQGTISLHAQEKERQRCKV